MAPRPAQLTAHTLAFHCTEQTLHDMHAYVWEFDDEAQDHWRRLGEAVTQTKKNAREQGQEEDHFLIPYSIVTTVLKQLTGGYVHLDKYLRYMVTLETVNADDLETVFTYLEGFCRNVPLADIPFAVKSIVAAKVAATKPQRLPLKDHIPLQEGQEVPDPPNWAYAAIKWLLAIKLAGQDFLDYPMEPVKEPRQKKDGTPYERTTGWTMGEAPARVRYRPMSTGELIAWNHPIGPAFVGHGHPISAEDLTAVSQNWPVDASPRELEYALSYLSTKMVTYPAFAQPVFLFDAHMRRINNTLIYSRTAMVDQADDKPILSISLDGRGLRRANRHALEILAVLEADRTPLGAVERRADSEKKTLGDARERAQKPSFMMPAPGIVRPLVSKKRSSAVGDGAGLHHLRMLLGHVQSVFQDAAEPFVLTSDGNVFAKRPFEKPDEAAELAKKTAKKLKKEKKDAAEYKALPFVDIFGLPSPQSVRNSLSAAGYAGVRFVCLWYRQPTRIRMLHGLAHMYGLDPHTLDPGSAKPIALGEGADVVFYEADAFLRHGTDIRRAHELDKIHSKVAKDGWLLATWCETEIPEAASYSDAAIERKQTATAVARELATADAKFQTRRALSTQRSPSQYLVGVKRRYKKKEQRQDGEPAYELKPITTPKVPWEDHPVFMGLLDLHRSIGVVDDRFEEALYGPQDAHPIPRMAFCGIHIRKQQANRRFRGQPKRIITASCLIPSPAPGGTWRHIAWTNLDPEGRWRNYNEAQNLFHAHNYPLHAQDGDSDTERWAQAGRDVRDALRKLPNHLMGLPYALIVDGHACRRAWPGLHNNKQGSGEQSPDDRLWLPTHGLGTHPVSIIRLNCFQGELPRLAYVTKTTKNGEKKPVKTSSDLYYPEARPKGHSWFLFTEPRNYGKKRYGQHKTRWRAEPAKKTGADGEFEENEMNSPWYAMTTREINPMHTQNGYDREALAIATARLSHHTLTWSDRTRYAAPLHGAQQMDLDHPQYRRSAPQDDPEQQQIIAEASNG